MSMQATIREIREARMRYERYERREHAAKLRALAELAEPKQPEWTPEPWWMETTRLTAEDILPAEGSEA